MSGRSDLALIARHELRLAWRDFHSMMTARRRWKGRTVALWALACVAFLHLVAYGMLSSLAGRDVLSDKALLVPLAGTLLLSFMMMLSQAIEQVTRVFYARGDLDLLLSSPLDAGVVSAVRIGTIAITSGAMTAMAAGPFINVMAVLQGWGWLCGYAVIPVLAAAATALAVVVTLLLFRWLGARRTRLAAQIVSAVIGAVFIVGVNLAAIISFQGYSRFAFFGSDAVMRSMPDAGSELWLPIRALAGDPLPLLVLASVCVAMLLAVIHALRDRFGPLVLHASAVSMARRTRPPRRHRFATDSPSRTLRQKEWLLLRRDPWLVSQSLMQIFYLIPPAVLLWLQFGSSSHVDVVVLPVLVMAAGQLAGGLAWLTVSGEDAPDLVASAPVEPGRVLRAKIEAVVGAVALFALPVIGLLALHSPRAALVGLLSVTIACASATAIQLWFRGQARRSHFRHRQTTSRIAALCEAGATIAWAGTAGLVQYGSPVAIIPAMLAMGILVLAQRLSPGAAADRCDGRPAGPVTRTVSSPV